MPQGRHRHSQPLHRMLPPLAVAGCAAAFAAVSLLSGDTGVLRVITVATTLTACAGAALARTWDRSAGREVAELTAARVRDEWRADERIAEVETGLEESRELRGRLEKKLRGKRAELARLRTEHADLLRRYATAESERAQALESRRRLQMEGARQPTVAAGPSPIGPAAFLKAEQALRELSRNTATQQAQRTVEHARRRDVAVPDEPQGRHAAGSDATPATPAETAAGLPVREHRLVPAVAAAVLPYAQPVRASHSAGHRAIGGFDFFGTQKDPEVLPSTPDQDRDHHDHRDQHDDHGHERHGQHDHHDDHGHERHDHAQADEPLSDPEVIDLTAHDETEQLDMSALRAKA